LAAAHRRAVFAAAAMLWCSLFDPTATVAAGDNVAAAAGIAVAAAVALLLLSSTHSIDVAVAAAVVAVPATMLS